VVRRGSGFHWLLSGALCGRCVPRRESDSGVGQACRDSRGRCNRGWRRARFCRNRKTTFGLLRVPRPKKGTKEFEPMARVPVLNFEGWLPVFLEAVSPSSSLGEPRFRRRSLLYLVWLTPDPLRTHGRPSGQECRLRLKRPESEFCKRYL
jgi:hypothetical protein